MQFIKTGILSIFLICLFFFVSLVHADIFMKQKVHQGGMQFMGQTQEPTDQVRTTWLSKDKIRSDEPGKSIIMRLDEKKIYMLDHEKKEYVVMPLDFGEKMSKEMQKEMGEDMSEKDKQAMMDMARGMTNVEVTVTPTSETKKIGEWNCKKYIQTMKMMMGTTTTQIWATKEIKMDEDLYGQLSAAMMGMQSGTQGFMGDMMSELKKIEGIPVLTETSMMMMGQEIKSSSELIEFREGTAPAGTFDFPEGYKQTENMGF
ncbi:MAG: hypothetical protein JXL67_12375 [Calditrichaeota bacterium]|nr:hypothetical protein [Calditrichota bacterium]